ncbi:putative 3-dehydroquinate dehydratase [Cystobacter fuscus DSM 2262]|uniref:3-dehydroquinate dehydratase n=1 Tax=Cystobacter fuscus (strain ATCC 25194 / DSM 2262 / NBRC 100088 / M29) TaxID=1242864 RepID=S9PK75_CYSF2|nr:type II 3-dehydroquinate dehydratase [Cystobacter fuscus]EPX64625.1 putative 3-dehydroquinate dehydratase [Cystobacter fuscus DSM 2262]
MGKRLLVLHGPNLNLLGEREGREGGRFADLDAALKARASALGLELTVVQSNHEGVLLDTLHAERSRVEGVVVSPSSLFGSYPLRDALEAIGLPALEVYLEELGGRESVVAEACVATLEGEGFDSYLQALERFASGDLTGESSEEDEGDEDVEDEDVEDEDVDDEDVEAEDEEAGEDAVAEAPVGLVKTLGRRGTGAKAPVTTPAPGPRKTLGRKGVEEAPPPSSVKTLGRKSPRAAPSEDVLSRELVRSKIADRLAGRLSPADLATWARSWWTRIQGGAPAETGHRELLEDILQRLTLANIPATRMSETELVDWMTRLEG